MLIARLLVVLAGGSACLCAALYLWTRNRLYWVLSKRICLVTAAAGLIFFGVLILERLRIL